ncbi:hypothetical protein SLA2020_149980 [Shorea laevis]
MVRSLELVKQIQNKFDVDGLLVTVALLGGRQVILLDNSEGCLEEFIKSNKELMDSWFEWAQQSSLTTMSSVSRLVWLRITGVPLQAWSERCFIELGGLIGEVILVDEDTKSKTFLCEGRVLILSDEKCRISNTMTLLIDGQAFPMSVAEEEWRTGPDWWLAGDRWNPVTESGSEYSSDNVSEANINVDGFLGDDEAILVNDCAVTESVLNLHSKSQFNLAERDADANGSANGLDKFGLGWES